MRGRRTRLSVALAGALALAAGGASALAARASAPPTLPTTTPDALIGSILKAAEGDPAVAGHAFVHVDLGVPQLVEGALAAEQPGLASLLTDHRLRVWRSSAGLRVTELLPMQERSLFLDRVHHRGWAWDSASFTAYRLLSDDEGSSPSPPPLGVAPSPFGGADPIDAVRAALGAISPSTGVRVGPAERVAGRDAYVLVIEPRTEATLIGRIEIAVDAEHRLPLSIRLLPRGSPDPALSVAFTDVGFGPVDPSVYSFSPPEGATLKAFPDEADRPNLETQAYAPTDVKAFGEGWASIVAVRFPRQVVGEAGAEGSGGLDPFSLLPLSARILSVRAVERGDHVWIVYGPVTQSALEAVESLLP